MEYKLIRLAIISATIFFLSLMAFSVYERTKIPIEIKCINACTRNVGSCSKDESECYKTADKCLELCKLKIEK